MMIAIARTPSASSGYTIAPPNLIAFHATNSSCINRFSFLSDARHPACVSWRLYAGGFCEWKLPFYPAVQRPARAVLIGKHADPGAVANQVSVIGEIHDRGAKFEHASIVGQGHALGNACIDLDIERQVPGISESASKSASVNPIDAERESMPVVNDSGR